MSKVVCVGGKQGSKLRTGELVHLEFRVGKSKFVKVGKISNFWITRSHENSLCLKLQE